jgi:hypothetical protein
VKSPDCDGLWIQMIFDLAEPNRYMIRSSNVYQIVGDWAIPLSSQGQAVQKKHLTVYDVDFEVRWIHIPVMSVIAMQNELLPSPIIEDLEQPADQEWKKMCDYLEMIDEPMPNEN